jgi:catechol 2,3-dioxygenase-like lactoylglutathione lyase family enzyme
MNFRALRLRSERGLPTGQGLRGDLRRLILSAAKDLPNKLPKRDSKIPRSLRSLGMRSALVLAALIRLPSASAQSPQPWTGSGIAAPQLVNAGAQAVAMVGFTVADMERSIRFYTEVLDFEKVSDDELGGPAYDELYGVSGARLRVVRMRLGDEYLQLIRYLGQPGRPIPPDSRSNDRWFQHVAIIVRDMDRAYARLQRFNVEHSSVAPQLLPKTIPQAAGIRAFYFKDPDGHPLEVLQFPPDKGHPKWHRASDQLFLGIDHTAIVVENTEASLAFYRDALGFRVAGESMNFGAEQARLNNVPGARLHITALRASRGPGIEFLEYLAPTGGRAYPVAARPTDLVHWQTTVLVPDTDSAAKLVRRGSFRLHSPDPVELPDTALGFREGILVRDPDGHAVQLAEF